MHARKSCGIVIPACSRSGGNPADRQHGCPIRPARLRREAAGKAKALGHTCTHCVQCGVTVRPRHSRALSLLRAAKPQWGLGTAWRESSGLSTGMLYYALPRTPPTLQRRVGQGVFARSAGVRSPSASPALRAGYDVTKHSGMTVADVIPAVVVVSCNLVP